MGINCSSIAHLKDNVYLKRLSGSEAIAQYDPFWNQLFSHSLPLPVDRSSALRLEEATLEYCKALFANNQLTGNFTSLVKVFLARTSELQSSAECGDKIFLWQTQNALCIIRQLCMFLVENMAEDKIIEQFDVQSLDERKKELFDTSDVSRIPEILLIKDFVVALMNVTVNVAVLPITQDIHVEVVNCLIVLLSVEMFAPPPCHHGPLHSVIFSALDSSQVNSFMHRLLQNFIEQRPSPKSAEGDYSGSFVLGLASTVAAGLRSVLKYQSGSGDQESLLKLKDALLAHQSALLSLVLINHNHDVDEAQNMYKDAVCSFRHIQGRQKGVESESGSVSPSFHINLSRLYTTLSRSQVFESSTLMLYFMLHHNPDVKAYIFSKTDIDALVMPILRILYVAPSQNSHHVFMALIVLFMLTEDDQFNKCIHETKISSVAWYTDRMLKDVSLGDIMILVIIRVIQFNMYHLRDQYLHTNCLAALANMSSQFRSIHEYPAQKIFELIAALAKRHRLFKQKVTEELPQVASIQVDDATLVAAESERDFSAETQILEEVLHMLLEIVNSFLSNAIHRQNSNLVYALLQKRQTIEQLKNYQVFQDILPNIETIIKFFSEKIDKLQQQSLDIREVREVIDNAILQLPSHYLHKFPELQFHYIEEDTPEQFFVPYVWSLVFNKSGIFWNPACIKLFSLEQ